MLLRLYNEKRCMCEEEQYKGGVRRFAKYKIADGKNSPLAIHNKVC